MKRNKLTDILIYIISAEAVGALSALFSGGYSDFFEKYERNLKSDGYIITDNMNFHGLVDKVDAEIESRNLRSLVRKIRAYRTYLLNHQGYNVELLDIGDGIAVASKK